MTAVLKLTIKPGQPVSLRPDEHSLAAIENTTVCDGNAESDRCIGENIVFHVYDRYNNRCRFPPMHTVTCAIRRLSSDDDDEEEGPMPVLVGAEVDPYLAGDMASHGMTCTFPVLAIAKGGNGSGAVPDGQYQLLFRVMDTSNDNDTAESQSQILIQSQRPAAVSWSTELNYTSSASRQAEINRCRAIFKPLLLDKQRYHRLDTEIKQKEKGIAHLIRNSTAVANLNDYANTPNELQSLLNRRRANLSDMTSRASQARPVKKLANYPPNPMALVGMDTIGLVVDLVFVQDDNEAFILSWAAIGLINALVVPTTAIAKAIYHNKDNQIKVWSVDQMNVFKVRLANGSLR